jgi:hypothetical protein
VGRLNTPNGFVLVGAGLASSAAVLGKQGKMFFVSW